MLSVFSNLLLQSEMHEELIEVAESQLAKDCGPTSSILFMYALALFKSGRVEDAIDPLRECIAKLGEQTYCAPFPGSTGAAPHHLLADCLAKQNQADEALEHYRTALDLSRTMRASAMILPDCSRRRIGRRKPLNSCTKQFNWER